MKGKRENHRKSMKLKCFGKINKMDKSLIILMKKKRSKPQVTKLEFKEKTFLPSLVKLKGSQGNKILGTVLSTN